VNLVSLIDSHVAVKLSFNSYIVSNANKHFHYFDLLVQFSYSALQFLNGTLFLFNLKGSNFCERLNCILFMLPHILHCTLCEKMLSHFGVLVSLVHLFI